jgi:hypothetical protein
MNRVLVLIGVIAIFSILFTAALYVTVGAVAFHFITKFW